MRRSRGIAGTLAALAMLGGGALASCASLDGLSGGPPLGADGGPALADGPVVKESGTDAPSPPPPPPPPPTDAGDAGRPPMDAASDHAAPADTGVPDTGVDAGHPMDSGSGDAASGPFCSTLSPAPTFCADFDEGAFDTGWSSSQSSNGTIGLDTTLYTSAPASLVASSPTTSATVQAALFNTFAVSGSAYHYAFDLHVDAVSANAEPIFAEVQLMTGASTLDYGLTFIVRSADALIEESYIGGGTTQFVDTSLSMPPPTGAWTRVTLDIGAPPSGTVTVRFDNTVVLAAHAEPAGSSNGAPVIAAGLQLFPGQQLGPCKGHIDNLTFQIDP